MSPAPDHDWQDPHAADIALRAPAALRVPAALRAPAAHVPRTGERALIAADVHVAAALARLSGVPDEQVMRCVALAVAAAREGHAFVQLDAADAARMRGARGLVGDEQQPAPLRLAGTRLYLDRYWREERRLAAALLTRNRMRNDAGELAALGRLLNAAFPGSDEAEQRAAAAVAMLRGLTVIAGGPGTGKTTTVARIVGLLHELAAARGQGEQLIALCAPTAKAAARLHEAVGGGPAASTIHRLLGATATGRFRYSSADRLPHDAVIVDETSMVPLWLMVRLVDAVRDDAQLILVGDPDQLSAIEVGAVLGDIVGPAADGPLQGAAMQAALERVLGRSVPPGPRPPGDLPRTFGDAVAVLRRDRRSTAPIGRLAQAIRRGDGDGAIAALRDPQGTDAISWVGELTAGGGVLRSEAMAAYLPMLAAAETGDARAALAALASFRLLCAHRHGPYGALTWAAQIERWLHAERPQLEAATTRYPGLPLMVTRNDYELGLHNGDSGIVVLDPRGEPRAVFDTGEREVTVAPSRLAAVDPLFAQTVHKSQGSEFDVAAVLLPEPDSPLLCRELLYTAVTRARRRLVLVGSEAAVRVALARPAGRASGLRELLWGPTPE